jgi:hypothetical protein
VWYNISVEGESKKTKPLAKGEKKNDNRGNG